MSLIDSVDLSILVPIHNGIEFTKKCIQNIFENLPIPMKFSTKLIIIDDGSTDGSSEWINKHYPETIIIKGNGDLWWSESINQGAKFAIRKLNSKYLLLWNNDIIIKEDYFNFIADYINSNISREIIGSQILNLSKPDIIWSNGGRLLSVFGFRKQIFSRKKINKVKEDILEVDWLTGMGTLIPSSVINNIGYWDSKNFPQYIGDLEFTYRAKKNGINLMVDSNLKIWNDTDNSGATLNIRVKDFFSSIFNNYSNRSLKTEILFMKKFNLFPLGLIGYAQRIIFEFIRLIKNKLLK